MLVKCQCGREWDIDIKNAGQRFRCPFCGESINIPGVAVGQPRITALVSRLVGRSDRSAGQHFGALTPTGQMTPSGWPMYALVAIILAGFLLGAYLQPVFKGVASDTTSAIQSAQTPGLAQISSDEHVSVADTIPALDTEIARLQAELAVASTHVRHWKERDFGGPEHVRAHIRRQALTEQLDAALAKRNALGKTTRHVMQASYQPKAPIEMTTAEWISAIKQEAELPEWWYRWAYHVEHPWLHARLCQQDYFEARRRSERTNDDVFLSSEAARADKHLRAQIQARKRIYNTLKDNDWRADHHLRNARSALSRQVMHSELLLAVRYMRKAMEREPK